MDKKELVKYKSEIDKENFAKEWALKWAKGVIIGHILGKISMIRAKGMIIRSIKMGVTKTNLDNIIKSIENDPTCFPSMSKAEKKKKIDKFYREIPL